MTPPTDMRAALRDKLIAAYDAAWDTTGEGKNAEYTGPRYTQDAYERERAEAIDKILAGAPPTVAELLPRVDAGHEVRWSDADGDEWRAIHVDSDGGSRIAIEMRSRDKQDNWWFTHYPLASDFLLPARLVEVSP